MAQTKSNLSKITINTNKTKTKNKKVNNLELNVILHENPIKNKIKATSCWRCWNWCLFG